MKKFWIVLNIYLLSTQVHPQNFWQQTNGPFCIDTTICEVKILTFNSNGGILAGTVGNGLYLTTNQGQIWEKTNYPGNEINSIVSINDSIIMCGSYYNSDLYISYDTGITWFTEMGYFSALSYDTLNDIVYWARGKEIYISNDFGQSWILIKEFSGPPTVIVTALYTTTENQYIFANVFYADHFGSWVVTYRSTDHGLSWEYGGISKRIFDMIENDLGTLYALTESLLFISYDEGSNWISKTAAGLCLSSDNFESLYIGTSDGIFYTYDEGNNWIRMDESGLQDTKINDIIINDDRIFVATRKGVHVSQEIVPVELVSFTTVYSNKIIELFWSTASELNNQGFEIERSTNKNDWLTIGFKEGKGTTTEQQNYSYTDDVNRINVTKLYYRLKQLDFDGSYEYSDIVEVAITPIKFSLSQNYPNPFNPSTKISWQSPVRSHQTLKVYDVLGREVATLVNEYRDAGSYEVEFDGSQLASGVYYYQLRVENFSETRKMQVLK